MRTIGLLGGSFDPIHVGHIALARAACIALKLDELHFVPAGNPWQKSSLQTSPQHRVAMLNIALKLPQPEGALFKLNTIEVERDGPSYSIDTLTELVRSQTEPTRWVLILGSDQLRNLASWHRYNELLQFGHIAVTQRESVSLQQLPPLVETLVSEYGKDHLINEPFGSLVFFRMPPVAVSSTQLRMALKTNSPQTALVNNLMPAGVFKYIQEHQLYK